MAPTTTVLSRYRELGVSYGRGINTRVECYCLAAADAAAGTIEPDDAAEIYEAFRHGMGDMVQDVGDATAKKDVSYLKRMIVAGTESVYFMAAVKDMKDYFTVTNSPRRAKIECLVAAARLQCAQPKRKLTREQIVECCEPPASHAAVATVTIAQLKSRIDATFDVVSKLYAKKQIDTRLFKRLSAALKGD